MKWNIFPIVFLFRFVFAFEKDFADVEADLQYKGLKI